MRNNARNNENRAAYLNSHLPTGNKSTTTATFLLAAALALAAPRAASAAMPCNVTNRGWLSGNFSARIHPTDLFGPSGLHGWTSQIPSSSTDFSVKVLRLQDSKSTVSYYPGRYYAIALDCGANECAFLATVEEGARADSGEANWRGNFTDPPTLRNGVGGWEYIGLPRVFGAAHSGTMLSTQYSSIVWRAPVALTYTTLVLRITVVVDQTTECEGLYKEVLLTSEVQCGDGAKDVMEECDDGNAYDGDGCDAGCKIELGWTCDRRAGGSSGAGSECTLAAIRFEPPHQFLVVEEGVQATYDMRLTTYLRPNTYTNIITRIETNTDDASVSFVGVSDFKFTSDGSAAWDVPQTVTIATRDTNRIETDALARKAASRRATINHIVSSTDPNYNHNYKYNYFKDTTSKVIVFVKDNDLPGLIVSHQTFYLRKSIDDSQKNVAASYINSNKQKTSINEAYYHIVITTEPEPDHFVNVKITSPASRELRMTPNSVNFDADNWSIPKVIKIESMADKPDNGVFGRRLLGTAKEDVVYPLWTTINHDVSSNSRNSYNNLNTTECCQIDVMISDGGGGNGGAYRTMLLVQIVFIFLCMY